MSEAPHVGGEVESYCGGCKEMRWHIVIALVGDTPVKVECISCHKQHGYRTGPAGSGAKAASKPRASAGKRAVVAPATFDYAAVEQRVHLAKSYAPAQTFKTGDVVRHPTFGLGLVTGTPSAQKMEARFESGPRLLVHDRKPAA